MTEQKSAADGATVLVTGASGFLGSHMVAVALAAGYKVRGTVRSVSDARKTAHLTALEGAAERLQLVEADLLDLESLNKAAAGCVGVFHTASPFFYKGITDPDAQLLKPAIEGTTNVLQACVNAGTVRRCVVTSSTEAILYGDFPEGHEFSAEDWSQEPYLREKGEFYALSKTLAEKAAWEFVKDKSLELAVVCPTLIVGPLLQPTLNTSSEMVLEFMNGTHAVIPNSGMGYVDVRDVALAHLLCFEKAEAQGHRYLCQEGRYPWRDWVAALKAAVPDARYPTDAAEGSVSGVWKCNNRPVQELGLRFRSLQDSLADTARSLVAHGFVSSE